MCLGCLLLTKSFLEPNDTRDLKNLVQLFNRCNLKTNVSKSNCMILSLRHVDSEYGLAEMLADTMHEEI